MKLYGTLHCRTQILLQTENWEYKRFLYAQTESVIHFCPKTSTKSAKDAVGIIKVVFLTNYS